MSDVLSNSFNIVLVILSFGILIFIHELGHFLAARLFSIGVKTFSIGFGPVLFSFKRKKTHYQVAAIPLGGYVSIVGESKGAELPEGFSEEESFFNHPAWQRFIVIFAGAFFNLLLAFFIFWGVIFYSGKSYIPNTISEVIEGSPAYEAGLSKGDAIVKIDGTEVNEWKDIVMSLQLTGGSKSVFTIKEHSGKIYNVEITPSNISTTPSSTKEKIWGIGIKANEPVHKTFSLFSSAGESYKVIVNMISFTFKGLGALFQNKVGVDNLSGPIGIVHVAYKTASGGLEQLLFFTAFISLNLAVVNLLPIPFLDGGHLVFIVIEMLIRRPVPEKIQTYATYVGLFIILGLMVLTTFVDILRFV